MKTNAARLTTKVRIPTASVNPEANSGYPFRLHRFHPFARHKGDRECPSVGKNTIKVMSAI